MKVEPTAERAVEDLRSRLERYDPFWGPQLVIAGAIALDFALPKRLTIGPSWVLPGPGGAAADRAHCRLAAPANAPFAATARAGASLTA